MHSLAVPGIGLSLDDAVQAQYISQSPLGKWLNIFSFTGLPVGDLMVLTPFQINSGDLWNGLAGALGTPGITLLNDTPGTARFFLEQSTGMGLIPIAVYPNGVVTITAAEVPEPAPVWLLAVALLALALISRKKRTGLLGGG
jgi:hypothetical protein